MKTRRFLLGTLMLILTLNVFAQSDQSRFGWELNGGVSQAVNKLGGTNLNTGLGFEGLLHYHIIANTGVYLGWGWNRFGADESFAGNETCFEETGYIFGLQFKHPIGSTKMEYYVRTAGLYGHIEIENSDGDVIKDSKHGFGYQLAGGIAIPMGKGWSFTPGLKYNSLKREIDFENSEKTLNHNYLSLRIGIIKTY